MLGDGELPDVVEQRSDLDGLSIEIGQVEPACQCRCVVLHPLHMTTAALVLGLNRARKHFRAVAVQLCPLGNAALLFHDATVIDAVGSIGQAERNQGEQPSATGPRRVNTSTAMPAVIAPTT